MPSNWGCCTACVRRAARVRSGSKVADITCLTVNLGVHLVKIPANLVNVINPVGRCYLSQSQSQAFVLWPVLACAQTKRKARRWCWQASPVWLVLPGL